MVWCGITGVGNLAGLVLFVFESESVFFHFFVAFIAFSGQQVSHGFTAGFHGRDSKYFQFDQKQPHQIGCGVP